MKVYICHVSSSTEFADRLRSALAPEAVVLDRHWELEAGESRLKSMVLGILCSSTFIMAGTAEFFESVQDESTLVRFQVECALQRWAHDEGFRPVLVLMERSNVPEILSRVPLYDMSTKSSLPDQVVQLARWILTPADMDWLPHHRDSFFVGREDQLEKLAVLLRQSKRVAVTGPKDCGKTALVVEYVHRMFNERQYDCGEWVDMRERGARLGARQLGLAGQNLGQRWLLVLDGASDYGDICGIVPRSGGHVIVTSDKDTWVRFGQQIKLPPLAADEASAFLRRRTEDGDEASAGALAELLGCIPGRLELVARHCESAKVSLKYCLVVSNDSGVGPLLGSHTNGENDSARKHIQQNLNQISANPLAFDLLLFFGFFAHQPEWIPLDLLLGSCGQNSLLNELKSTHARHSVLSLLVNNGLLADRQDDSVQTDRLVQEVVMQTAEARQSARIPEFAASALRLLTLGFVFDHQNEESWKECERLLPHVNTCLNRNETPAEDRVPLLIAAGRYCGFCKKQHREGMVMLEEALAIVERPVL